MIRFSSFGDIIQAAAVPGAFRSRFPKARVDWLLRSDFQGLLNDHKNVDRVIAFHKKAGLLGLLRLAWQLGAEPYTHIYDAHANVRSQIVLCTLRLRRSLLLPKLPWPHWAQRPKSRLRRFLFFRFRLRSALPRPFLGVVSFLAPLRKWGVSKTPPAPPQYFIAENARTEAHQLFGDFRPDVLLIPSAAWEKKRWPVNHWKRLIDLMPESTFAILGGPDDAFCEELAQIAPQRVRNFAGRLSLAGSAAALELGRLAISADTGLLHVADQLGRPVLALIGPTAFGYPSHRSSKTLEIQLECKPCSKDGRGRCSNSLYQRCMVEITPEWVANCANETLKDRR
ncbi:MAG: glycosyltransferase family 9 protein [Bdellovibrionaceae bacterium]|nr:glycosyltransferase family 9 protein [Pseudobdellovibrionaceae bacterium]